MLYDDHNEYIILLMAIVCRFHIRSSSCKIAL
jgi:hypothetical protein